MFLAPGVLSSLTQNTALKNPVLLMKCVTFIRNCYFIALNLFHFERKCRISLKKMLLKSHRVFSILDTNNIKKLYDSNYTRPTLDVC